MNVLPVREDFDSYEEYIKALSVLAISNIDAWTQLLYERKKEKEHPKEKRSDIYGW